MSEHTQGDGEGSSGTVTIVEERWPMSKWQPIEDLPTSPMPVLLYLANLQLEDDDVFPPYRDEAFEVGFWDGEKFYVNGTGHEAFEEWWMEKYQAPTHWMPILKPPKMENDQ